MLGGGRKKETVWGICTAVHPNGSYRHKPEVPPLDDPTNADVDHVAARTARVQRMSVRYHCARDHTHTGVELISPEPETLPEIMAAKQGNSPLRGMCYSCGVEVRVMAYFQCDGKPNGCRCKASSKTGDVIALPQLVDKPANQICAVLSVEPEEEFMLRFEPCGCLISMEGFAFGVKSKVEDGTGRGRVALSPESGQFAFSCPAGACPLCADSFVHDIHHYKLCENMHYRRLHSWGLDKYQDANPDPSAPPPEEVGAAVGGACAQPEDPMASLHQSVADLLYKAMCQVCPAKNCDIEGVKDGNCCHIVCVCNMQFCYWCHRPLQATDRTDGPICLGCPMYLEGAELGNGTQLGFDAHIAMQEFCRLRALRLLHELRESVGHAVFDAFYAGHTDMFQNFAPDDGLGPGQSKVREHAPLQGVTLALRDIVNYKSDGLMP